MADEKSLQADPNAKPAAMPESWTTHEGASSAPLPGTVQATAPAPLPPGTGPLPAPHPIPASWNDFGRLAQAVFDALAQGGPEAAMRLQEWIRAEEQQRAPKS